MKPSLKATKADQKQIADYDFEPEDEDENNMGVFSNSKYENDDDFI